MTIISVQSIRERLAQRNNRLPTWEEIEWLLGEVERLTPLADTSRTLLIAAMVPHVAGGSFAVERLYTAASIVDDFYTDPPEAWLGRGDD